MTIDPDPKHCSEAKYNVLSLKSSKKSVLDVWPELTKYPEFLVDYGNPKGVHLNSECILRFCLIFYQKNSLSLLQPNFWQRKRIAAEWAGFTLDKETGKFSNNLEQVLLGNNAEVNRLIVRVLQLSDDINFQHLMTLETVRDKHMDLLIGGNHKDAKNLLDVIDRVTDKMKVVHEEMLRDDQNTPIASALYHSVVEANLPTPENIAAAKKDGQLDQIIEGPYEIKYRKGRKKRLQ